MGSAYIAFGAAVSKASKGDVGVIADYGLEQDFEVLFREAFPLLAQYCAALTKDRDLGTDLAQEALARTWAHWSKVAHPKAYRHELGPAALGAAPSRRSNSNGNGGEV